MHKKLPKLFIFLDRFNNKIFENNSTNIGIVYRNYNSTRREIELVKIAKACKKNRYQLFVSNDVKLALKVKADGIYIPSFNANKSYLNLEKKNFKILGSAHNQKEIHRKIQQKCNIIFLSPIFFVKKAKNFLDIHKFNSLSLGKKNKLMALGGINEKNFKKLKMVNTKGFAGISIFKKKTGLKKGRLFKE